MFWGILLFIIGAFIFGALCEIVDGDNPRYPLNRNKKDEGDDWYDY